MYMYIYHIFSYNVILSIFLIVFVLNVMLTVVLLKSCVSLLIKFPIFFNATDFYSEFTVLLILFLFYLFK
jgi:hypothetical protein